MQSLTILALGTLGPLAASAGRVHPRIRAATGTLYWSSRENWGTIPEEKRDSRADGYCDIFSYKSVVVPWGRSCARLEAGSYTGNGGPNDRCDVGIPSRVSPVDRRYVIGETVGAVSVFLSFSGIPDRHEFALREASCAMCTPSVMTARGGKGKVKSRARGVAMRPRAL
ncbi:hypothetical protein VTK56DRAFT_10177 [Thermocarpiscus australiensis]